MTKIPDHLVKVNNNVYLSKHDPRFLEKYLAYFPNDASKLYEFGEQLEKKGMVYKAMSYYQKAADQGNRLALRKVRNFQEIQHRADGEVARILEREKLSKRLLTFALLLILIALLLTVVVGFDYFREVLHFHQIEHHYYDKEIIHHPATEVYIPTDDKVLIDPAGETSLAEIGLLGLEEKQELLAFIAVQNGVERYREHWGRLPESLSRLVLSSNASMISQLNGTIGENGFRENWLSAIPQGISDEVIETIKQSGEIASSQLLELHFYPDTNQLALALGDHILSLYSVASGTDPLPFTESKITERVVNPFGPKDSIASKNNHGITTSEFKIFKGSNISNLTTGNAVATDSARTNISSRSSKAPGSDMIYGSRGLVLHDQYAIHGTNEPSSIGEQVTHGCLRMFNEDIESLYPYVALGTPFKVKTGTPGVPIFENGLPPLNADFDYEREEKPNTIYNWRG